MPLFLENRQRMDRAILEANQLANDVGVNVDGDTSGALLAYFAFMHAYQNPHAQYVRQQFDLLRRYLKNDFENLVRQHCLEIPRHLNTVGLVNRIFNEGLGIYLLRELLDDMFTGQLYFDKQQSAQEQMQIRSYLVYPLSQAMVVQLIPDAEVNPVIPPISLVVEDALPNVARFTGCSLPGPGQRIKLYVPKHSQAARLVLEQDF